MVDVGCAREGVPRDALLLEEGLGSRERRGSALGRSVEPIALRPSCELGAFLDAGVCDWLTGGEMSERGAAAAIEGQLGERGGMATELDGLLICGTCMHELSARSHRHLLSFPLFPLSFARGRGTWQGRGMWAISLLFFVDLANDLHSAPSGAEQLRRGFTWSGHRMHRSYSIVYVGRAL